MSFSSRRRNYLLTPHRRDGLIEWYVVTGVNVMLPVERAAAGIRDGVV
jgi:hypothetical protein